MDWWTHVRSRLMLRFKQKGPTLHPAYHGSICPELRVSARIGQLLPPEVDGAPWKLEVERPPYRPAGGRGARQAEALTMDGRLIAMTATKAHLAPWSSLRLSMGVQWSRYSDVQG